MINGKKKPKFVGSYYLLGKKERLANNYKVKWMDGFSNFFLQRYGMA